MKRIINILIGILIISITINYFIIPNKLIVFGTDGLACLLSYITGANIYINMFLLNILVIFIALIFIDFKIIKYYFIPAILIPFGCYITSFLPNIYPIELPEMMLNIIVSSFLLSYGYGILYKQGLIGGTTFLLDNIISNKIQIHFKYSFLIDIIILVLYTMLINFTYALYSLIIISVVRYLIDKTKLGTNESKMFYIITKKEKEVREYIINDLKYELTTLDVKGGYTNKDSKILLCVISANDYYKLKEGIKLIDHKAFIAIVDTYDVLRKRKIGGIGNEEI